MSSHVTCSGFVTYDASFTPACCILPRFVSISSIFFTFFTASISLRCEGEMFWGKHIVYLRIYQKRMYDAGLLISNN